MSVGRQVTRCVMFHDRIFSASALANSFQLTPLSMCVPEVKTEDPGGATRTQSSCSMFLSGPFP